MSTNAVDVDLQLFDVDPSNSEALERFMSMTEAHYNESWPEEAAEEGWRDHYTRQIIERMKTDSKRWLWLVELDGQSVGLANFYLSGPEDARIGTIQELYIVPAQRNKHLGAALFARVKEAMLAEGVGRIKASVAVDEPGKCRFFENYGFRMERVHLVLNTDRSDDS